MVQDKFPSINIASYGKTLWFLAIIITLSSAIYQRMTGPTYPMRGKIKLENTEISFKLLRSETTNQDAPIRLMIPDTSISGYVKYKRYRSHDEWSQMPLLRSGDTLQAFLPKQPAAGKIMYFVYLNQNEISLSLTKQEPIVLRYKGAVPAAVLIPHILIMFLAMLFSNRTALEALDSAGRPKRLMYVTIALFFVGGLILGPVVQKFAFGEFWTGIPFGHDLTDNKTLIGMLGWLFAWFTNRGDRKNRLSFIFAAVLLLAVYLIPHSVLGSELDYTKVNP